MAEIPGILRQQTTDLTSDIADQAESYKGMDTSYLSTEPDAQKYAGTGAAVSQAMAKRYEGEIQTIINQQQRADFLRKFKMREMAFEGQAKKYGYYLKRKAAIRKRKMAEDAQRASLLGNVLGLAGAAVGAYVAGPTGAMVGAQAGQSTAKMASSSDTFEGEQ